MHSIAHYIIEHNSSLNVLYVTSEDFTNEVINSIQHKKQEELRSKYRNIDVLLVDDIQFVIGKEVLSRNFSILLMHFITLKNRSFFLLINLQKNWMF